MPRSQGHDLPCRLRRLCRTLLAPADRCIAAAAAAVGGGAGGAGGSCTALPEAPPPETIRSELRFPPCRRAEARSPRARGVAADACGAVQAGCAGGAAGSVAGAAQAVFGREREGACLVSVCTRNYLYFARTAIASFRRHHPEMPAFLGIVDWDGTEPLAVEGTTLLSCGLLGVAGFDYLALKYNALEMCGAMKPFLLDHVLRHTRCQKIVFVDSDVHTFAPFAQLLARLDHHDFVVTPHTLAPPPHPERFWERPSLGDLAFAGQLNSGLFGLRATPEAKAFLDVWRDLVTRPGAFMLHLGGQSEQNSFNWVTSFVDRVHVLRDPAYNVAYWSLHDRSVRFAGLDDPAGDDRWTVDGKPLVAFHFSGYSLENPYHLSRHDRRHSLYVLPSVARLTELYAERLRASGANADRRLSYRFDAFPSGIAVDERMRRICKEHETLLAAAPSPWTAAGEAHHCEALLSPIACTGSLLPALFDVIYNERLDLQRSFPDARLQPEAMLQWIAANGIYEYGYQEIYDAYRPVLPSRHGVVALSRARRQWPRIFSGLRCPLGADRQRLLARLDAAGKHVLAACLRTAALERYYVSPIWIVRRIVAERADVRQAFPDLLDADAAAFVHWLETYAPSDECLPAGAAAAFAARAQGRSLARIFSFMNRSPHLMDRWPLGLVGEGRMELAANLLAATRDGTEYDADDVLMYLWTMERKPWAGLALTFELASNACRTPSPLLDEGQDHLLGPLLERDRRFGAALARYRQEYGTARHRRQAQQIRRLQRPRGVRRTVFDALDLADRHGASPRCPDPASAGGPLPDLPGVNLFGYHKSPIGLGCLTRGLAVALRGLGAQVQPNVLGNAAMDADLAPADFVRTFDHRLDTNLFVSYPHLHELLLPMFPEHVTRCRRNVAYLAWEQRDGSHYWPEVFRDFDQVWALSDFAASSLRRFMRREVSTVPCVLDFAALPAPGSKSDFGLEPGKLTFLYVFDANSSLERKNPEAAIRAFAAAFAGQDDVCLVLRAANGDRPHHREKIKRLVALVPAGLDVRLVLAPLPHAEVLRLLAAGDCYVSLHRAEGFGYTCAEAMAYGLPVIATGYSGNLQFMDRDNSLLVDYREAAVAVADGPYQRGSMWAEPDVEHAAALMRRVYDRPDLARVLGARGREAVRLGLSPEAIGGIALAALGWQGAAAGAGRAASVAAAAAATPAGVAAAPAVTRVSRGSAAGTPTGSSTGAVTDAAARTRRRRALRVSFGTR